MTTKQKIAAMTHTVAWHFATTPRLEDQSVNDRGRYYEAVLRNFVVALRALLDNAARKPRKGKR